MGADRAKPAASDFTPTTCSENAYNLQKCRAVDCKVGAVFRCGRRHAIDGGRMRRQRYRTVKLIDGSGEPLQRPPPFPPTQPDFHYPFAATPCFLHLAQPARASARLVTRDQRVRVYE